MVAAGFAVACAALAPVIEVGSVVERALGEHNNGWMAPPTHPQGCDTPCRLVVVGADTTTAAIIGDTRTAPQPGCDPSYIFQDFVCDRGDPAAVFCTVSFDVSMWRVAGDHAAVVLVSGARVVAREIPGDRGGRRGRYAVSIAAQDGVRVVFAVWNSAPNRNGTRSVLMVDNVEIYSTAKNLTTGYLAPLDGEALSFDPLSTEGHYLPRLEGFADCNENGVPDSFEISQGIASDRDGDGRPDDCLARKRQIDWVLLGLCALVLTALIVRRRWKSLRGPVH